MSTYEDCKHDVTVECENCHDLYDCEIQLYSLRDIVLIKAFVEKMFKFCLKCGPENGRLVTTISNAFYTAEEIKLLNKMNQNIIFRSGPGISQSDND
jgi:hypothetical protein